MKRNNTQWGEIIEIWSTDKEFEELIRMLELEYHLNAVYIKEADTNTSTDKKYNPYTAPWRSTSQEGINHKYIYTNVELSKDTFAEAIKQGHYQENECRKIHLRL